MQYGGSIANDAPDPAHETYQKVLNLGVAVAGLLEQMHVEDTGDLGLVESWEGADGRAELRELTVSRSYTLWRHPEQRSDPANLVELDESTRSALEQTRGGVCPRQELDRYRSGPYECRRSPGGVRH